MPEVVIIAGPNGAGKTTFAGEYLSHKKASWPFVNVDEIHRNFQAAVTSDVWLVA